MTIELTITAQKRFAATLDAYNELKAGGAEVTDWPADSKGPAYKYMRVDVVGVPTEQAPGVGATVLAVAMATGSFASAFRHNGTWNFSLSLAFYDVVTEVAQ